MAVDIHRIQMITSREYEEVGSCGNIFPREALDWFKLTGRQTIASYTCFRHSDGDFMIYRLIEKYFSFTESI